MQSWHIAGGIALALVVIFGVVYMEQMREPSEVCIDTTCYLVELAKSNEEKIQGLMYRTSLAHDTGMLFMYDEERYYGFWMKNTLIPLDILWINSTHHIVHIEESVPPCTVEQCPTYRPLKKAHTVLEIPGGSAEVNGIIVGEEVTYKNVYK